MHEDRGKAGEAHLSRVWEVLRLTELEGGGVRIDGRGVVRRVLERVRHQEVGLGRHPGQVMCERQRKTLAAKLHACPTLPELGPNATLERQGKCAQVRTVGSLDL